MFGFRSMNRLTHQALKASKPASRQDQIMVLVSKEDIYRQVKGTEPVLLLKKGHAVEPQDLPRYIKNGVRPSQFQIEYQSDVQPPVLTEIPSELQRVPQAATNPITDAETLARMARARKRVLILEPEQRSLKRLIDCLFVCGFSLDRIHPLRVPTQLEWTLEKHQPDILVIDYHLQGGGKTGFALLQSLKNFQGSMQIILTMDAQPVLAPLEDKLIRKLCADRGIPILSKPISRFALTDALAELAQSP